MLQLLSAFHDKTKATLALESCGHTFVYRRALVAHIKATNDSKTCSSEQREIILHSLDVVCDVGKGTDTVEICEKTMDDVIVFLLGSFLDLLELSDAPLMKCVIRVVGAFVQKSAHARYKLHSYRIFQKFLDAILSKTTSVFVEGDSVAQSVIDIAMKSQLMIEMLLEMKTILTLFSHQLSDLNESNHYSEKIAESRARLADSASILRSGRDLVSSLVKDHCFTSEDEALFQSSRLIPCLIERCVLDDLRNCSHLLKMLVTLADNTMLLDILLQENAVAFTQLFLSTVRCPEKSVEDFLVKFWLVYRTCENVWLRNFLFQREGVILEILAIMRTSSLSVGDSLEVLASFCDDICFFDMSLSSAQMILHFGEIFQFSDHSDSKRHNAEEILLIFAEGLEKTSHHSSQKQSSTGGHQIKKQLSDISESISCSFIESGLLFVLLSTISVNDSSSEWRAKGANLLHMLIQNPQIQEVFLDEPLGVLRCLVDSVDSFVDRISMCMELIAVTEVLACNPLAHGRLFESDVVRDIIRFMAEVEVHASNDSHLQDPTKYILRSLNILDIITNVSETSCVALKNMDIEEIFTSLLHYHDSAVLEIVREILNKIY